MKDFRMRRKDREADENTAKDILLNGEYGVLSTVGDDGFPYGVPLNYAFDGEKIYFHCAKDAGHKEVNLAFSNKVSFCVVSQSEIVSSEFTSKFSSVIVFGTAEKTEEKKRYALELLVEKYSPQYSEKGKAEIEKFASHTDIFEISILKMSAKVHK